MPLLKRILKALLRPFVRPVLRRVEGRVDSRLGSLQARMDTLERDVTAFRSYVPALLNAISAQNAAARESARGQEHLHARINELAESLSGRIGQVEQRAEFIRREVMFELRYGGGEKKNGVEPRVVNAGKLKDRPVRLNLGCGHIPMEGYVNVDGRPLPGVDVVADVRSLPFGEAEVDEIYSAHLLEHFPLEELARSLLPYWHGLLRPGGRFVAVVPDAESMAREYAAGRYSFEDLRLVTYGEQEYEGDFHFNMFSHESLVRLLRDTGFGEVKLTDTGRRNGAALEMEVVACKAPEGA